LGEVTTLALPQLVMWPDPTRLQMWPELLAAIPANESLPSPTHFGRKYVTGRMTDEDHSAATDVTRNLPGLELRGEQLVLRGLGFLKKANRNYTLSEIGVELGQSYAQNARDRHWVVLLANALLNREPRLRAFVRLLSSDGAELRFPGSGWFAGPYSTATIQRRGFASVYPFRESDNGLLELLADDPLWCLGAWKKDVLLTGREQVRFRGRRTERISFYEIGRGLRAACEVLLHLRLIMSEGDAAYLDTARARANLGEDLASDFVWTEPAPSVPMTPLQILADVLPSLRTDTGFVVASQLRAVLKDRGIANPDRTIAGLEREGRVRIVAEDYGQRRHGVGLYDDPRKQLVKLRLASEERG